MLDFNFIIDKKKLVYVNICIINSSSKNNNSLKKSQTTTIR